MMKSWLGMAVVVAMGTGGCSSAVSPSGNLSTTGPCEIAAVDRHDGKAESILGNLIVVPSVDKKPASTEMVKVLTAFSERGASVAIAGLEGMTSLDLAGKGSNPTERCRSRTERLTTALGEMSSQLAAMSSVNGDPSALIGQGLVRAAALVVPNSRTVLYTVVIGTAVGGEVTSEAVDRPEKMLETLSAEQRLYRPGDIGHGAVVRSAVQFVTPTAAESGTEPVQRFWWVYASSGMGASLTSWSPGFPGLKDQQLPEPAKITPVPAARSTPTVAATQGPQTTTTIIDASFDVNSYDLTREVSDQIAGIDYTGVTAVTCTGYTDNQPNPNDPGGYGLSKNRAMTVCAAIAQHVPTGTPINVVGRGEEDPRAPNTFESRYLNRRVEVELNITK